MKQYDYQTTFDTATRTMIFIIHPRLQVVVNFREYEILIIKDDKIIDRENFKGERFTLTDMEMILRQACEAAEKIKRFETINN